MSITAALRAYLEQFPGLSGGVMHVDWLPSEAQTYTIDSVPAEPCPQNLYGRQLPAAIPVSGGLPGVFFTGY